MPNNDKSTTAFQSTHGQYLRVSSWRNTAQSHGCMAAALQGLNKRSLAGKANFSLRIISITNNKQFISTGKYALCDSKSKKKIVLEAFHIAQDFTGNLK